MKGRHISIVATLPSVGEKRIKVSSEAKVKDLKAVICRNFKLETEYVKLIVEDKILEDEAAVEELNLAKKKVIVDYLWARHLLLWNLEEQAKIRSSTVLVAGAGAIGNEVSKNLAMLGVKRLVIVDFDVVELSNVSRMFLFGINDTGKPKAEVLGAKLVEKYPFVEVYAYTCALEQLPLEVFLRSDVIVSGLDNIASRVFLTATARKYQIPMVDGGTLGHRARVQTYIPSEAACPVCNLPIEKYAEMIKLKNPCDPKIDGNKMPSVVTANSFVASIQTQETLKILMGFDKFRETGRWPKSAGRPLHGVLVSDLKYNRQTLMKLNRNPNCIVCGEKGIAKPVNKLTLSLDKIGDTTSCLLENVQRKIGKPLKLYTTSDTPPKRIEPNQSLSKYCLHRGSHIIALTPSQKEHWEETILTIV